MDTKKLHELCISITDCPHSTPKWTEKGKIVIRNTYIKNGKLDLSTLSFTDEENFKKRIKRAQPVAGDIIITREAPMGEVCMIPDGVECCLGQRMVLLKVDSSVCDNRYLLYALLSNYVQHQIAWSEGTGTTVSNLRIPHLENLEIPYIPLNRQKAIANILSSLDEKIELNNQMNKTLEEMAQALFKRWFVDFEFPNKNGEPYKSSGGEMVDSELGTIPKGWEVKLFNTIAETYNGYSYKGKELMESNSGMVTIKNFDRNGGYKLDGLKEIRISDKVKAHHYINIGDVVVAHTDLTQGAEIIGNPVIISSKGKYDKLIMSMDTVKVSSKVPKISNVIVYYILKDKKFKDYALGYVNGTTVLHLSKKAIPEYRIALPCDLNIIEELDSKLSPIMEKISCNFIEKQTLIETRDTLLPRLMSGEIRVVDTQN